LGASPDGISEDGVMLEIKCPVSRKITGIPPRYYWCQVQGQLEVCELDRCDFLECKLKEYEDEEEYLFDSYNGNNELNEYGLEKGIIAKFYIEEEDRFKFFYGPVNAVGEKLEKWKEEIVEKHDKDFNENNNMVFHSFDYWYLEEISCVPIYRNQEWFNEAKFKLEDFWEEVLYYREMGLEFLKEELNNQKEEKKKIRQEKKDIKTREQDLKKQKKIKDYINLNDDNDNEKNDDINSNQSKDSNETSDTNSNNQDNFDDIFGSDAISIDVKTHEKSIKNKKEEKSDYISYNEFSNFEF
jgi:hypothetical protein